MNDGRILKDYRYEKRGKIQKNYWCEGIDVIMSFSEDGHTAGREPMSLSPPSHTELFACLSGV